MLRILSLHLILILVSACQPSAEIKSMDTAGIDLARSNLNCPFIFDGFNQQFKYSDRLKEAQKQAKSTPQSGELEQLGWAYVSYAREKQSPEHYYLAGQVADCIDRSNADSMEAALLRAHVFHQQHQFADAESIAAVLVAERGLWFDYAVYGDALVEQGKLDEATAAYQQMVDLKPGGEAYGRIGYLRWLTGDLQGAMEATLQAVRSTNSRDRAAKAFWNTRLAYFLWADSQHDTALSILEKVDHDVEGYLPAVHLKANIFLGLEKYSEAVVVLERLLLSDSQPQYLWSYWEALTALGNGALANEVQNMLVSNGVKSDKLTTSLFLSALEIDEEAAKKLATDEFSKRQDANTLGALAIASFVQGDIGDANNKMNKALATGSIEPRLYLHAARISAKQGDIASTKDWLAKARVRQQMLFPSERKLLANLLISS